MPPPQMRAGIVVSVALFLQLIGSAQAVVVSRDDVGRAVATQGDGKLIVVGNSNRSTQDFGLARFNLDGSLDSSFGTAGMVRSNFGSSEAAREVAIDSTGRIVVAGEHVTQIDAFTSVRDMAIVRYNPNGSLDTTFSGDGFALVSFPSLAQVGGVAIQSDDKIVVAGNDRPSNQGSFYIARLETDGDLDPTFGGDGKVERQMPVDVVDVGEVRVQGDGKIVAGGGGDSGKILIVRYLTNGDPDTDFDTDGLLVSDLGLGGGDTDALAIQSNGALVGSGYFQSATPPQNQNFRITRHLGNGTPDTGFDGDGAALVDMGTTLDAARGVAIQASGDIVAGGVVTNNVNDVNTIESDFALTRVEGSGGSLDTTFGSMGRRTTAFGAGTDDDAQDLVLRSSDAAIAIAGSTGPKFMTRDFALALYDANGTLLPSFSGDGLATVNFTDIDPDPPPPSSSGGGGSSAPITGTSGPDNLTGTAGDDVIDGGAGNDSINGGGGNDTILGGSGNDKVTGGPGNDNLSGGAGRDLLNGGPGNDRMNGGAGRDRCPGGGGRDRASACDSTPGVP